MHRAAAGRGARSGEGGRRTADGGRRRADGGRRTADGGWRTADGVGGTERPEVGSAGLKGWAGRCGGGGGVGRVAAGGEARAVASSACRPPPLSRLSAPSRSAQRVPAEEGGRPPTRLTAPHAATDGRKPRSPPPGTRRAPSAGGGCGACMGAPQRLTWGQRSRGARVVAVTRGPRYSGHVRPRGSGWGGHGRRRAHYVEWGREWARGTHVATM